MKIRTKRNLGMFAKILVLGAALMPVVSACTGSSSACEGQGACMIYFYTDS